MNDIIIIFCMIGYMLGIINMLIAFITMFNMKKNAKFLIISILGYLVGTFPQILHNFTKPTITDMNGIELSFDEIDKTLNISKQICGIVNLIIQAIIFIKLIKNIVKNKKKEGKLNV